MRRAWPSSDVASDKTSSESRVKNSHSAKLHRPRARHDRCEVLHGSIVLCDVYSMCHRRIERMRSMRPIRARSSEMMAGSKVPCGHSSSAERMGRLARPEGVGSPSAR